MKGIVLAGGTGSRLSPLTAVTNKHLLPVGNYPMIFHPIARLKQAGIKDILVVTGRDHMGDVMELLGSGHDFGLDFTYKVQDQAGCRSDICSFRYHWSHVAHRRATMRSLGGWCLRTSIVWQ